MAFSKGLVMMANTTSVGGSSMMEGSNDGNGAADSATDKVNKKATNGSSSMTSLPVPLPSGGGATERELEYFVRDALSSCILLDRYPRCVIQVVIQIVQADGGVLATAVNCAVMALMDAGVAMRGLPVAATCVVIGNCLNVDPKEEHMEIDGETKHENDDVIWLDPTAEEESGEGHAVVVLVTDASSISKSANAALSSSKSNQEEGKIITSFTFGAPLSLQGLLSSVESTQQSSAAMVAFMRLAVEQKVQREAQTLWS